MGLSIQTHFSTQDYFRERLSAALSGRRLTLSDDTQAYLIHLLDDYADPSRFEGFGVPLVQRLANAIEAESIAEQLRLYRTLGDNALYTCGFWGDHLSRVGVSQDYAVQMGARGYAGAKHLVSRAGLAGLYPVYDELSHRFSAVATALEDVKEATSMRTPQDIIRLYDRWKQTKSPVLAARLQAQGVFPMIGDEDVH